MTKDDIIRMAREACGEGGDPFVSGWITMDHGEFERFAALVAAAEREACAQLVYEAPCECCWPEGSMPITEELADQIRARGQA